MLQGREQQVLNLSSLQDIFYLYLYSELKYFFGRSLSRWLKFPCTDATPESFLALNSLGLTETK